MRNTRVLTALLVVLALLSLGLWVLRNDPESKRSERREAAQRETEDSNRAKGVENGGSSKSTNDGDQDQTDPTDSDQGELFDAVEGIVLEDGKPVSNGIARILKTSGYAWPERLAVPMDQLPECKLAPDGTFRFEGLRGLYLIRIDVEGIALPRYAAALVMENRPTKRIVIRIGRAAIEGTVFNAEGAPEPAAEVIVRVMEARQPQFQFRVLTDNLGRYVVERIPPGKVHLECVVGARSGKVSLMRRYLEAVTVPADTRVRCDLGDATGTAIWTGRLLTASGETISCPASLSLTEMQTKKVINVPLDSDASFSARLLPGTYKTFVRLRGSPRPVRVRSVTVVGSNFTKDITLPGTTLRGSIDYAGRPSAPVDFPARVLAKNANGRVYKAVPEQGRFTLYGMPPGRYEVSLVRYFTKDRDGPFDTARTTVVIAESSPETSAELRFPRRD